MEALVAYYRKYEPVVPNFRAVVSLGARELAREEFRGRSTEASTTSVPMAQVLSAGAAGTELPLTFTRDGDGHALLRRAPALRRRTRCTRRGSTPASTSSAATSPTSRTAARPAATTYAAGDLVRVTLTFRLTKERRFVAVTDPLPAGFEAVEIVVRDDGTRSGVTAGSPDQRRRRRAATGATGGASADSITSSATTIAFSSLPPGSPKASTSSATSSARRRPGRSGRRRRGRKRCTSRRCSAGRRRRSIEVKR